MKLRHLRVLRNTNWRDGPESRNGAARTEDSKPIRDELRKCKKLMKHQRLVIAKYEVVLRRQRRFVSISYAVTLGVLTVVALTVAAGWFGWLEPGWLLPP